MQANILGAGEHQIVPLLPGLSHTGTSQIQSGRAPTLSPALCLYHCLCWKDSTFLFFLFQGAQFPIMDQSNATFPVRSLDLSHPASALLLLGDPLVMWSSGWEGGRGLAVELKGRCVSMSGL